MPDYKRWFRAGRTYFFTIVTFDRQEIFSDARSSACQVSSSMGAFELSSLGQRGSNGNGAKYRTLRCLSADFFFPLHSRGVCCMIPWLGTQDCSTHNFRFGTDKG